MLERKETSGLPCGEESTYSQADFLASHFPGSVGDAAVEMTATSGRRCSMLYKLSSLHGLSLRMLTKLLLSKTEWYSSGCALIWRERVTTCSRLLFQLAPSLPDTVETGFSFWPTPSARDWKDTPGMAQEGTNPDGSKRVRNDQLARRVYQTEGSGSGSLNPAWVEWLMGYPDGWTDLEDSETP